MHIVQQLFEVVSFSPGGESDWNRLRWLFAPCATVTHVKEQQYRVADVEQMLTEFKQQIDEGTVIEHHEKLLEHRIQRFENLAHVWCSYEAEAVTLEGEFYWRGFHSIQLIREDSEWHILNLLWRDEE